MEDKGRHLFLQYLQKRARRQWLEASIDLKLAAQWGNPDACWHWAINDYWDGGCDVLEDDHDLFDGILSTGAKAGHSLCQALQVAARENFVGVPSPPPPPPPLPITLEVEVLWSIIYFKQRGARIFTSTELETLRLTAENAANILDPWPIFFYIKYVLHHHDLMKQVDPRMIGYALFLCNDNATRMVYKSSPHYQGDIYIIFNVNSIGWTNYFKLPKDSLIIIRYTFGYLSHLYYLPDGHYDDNKLRCLSLYYETKTSAYAAAFAWLICFRRKAFYPWLSRDTATLVAKAIANPLQWALLPPSLGEPEKSKQREME